MPTTAERTGSFATQPAIPLLQELAVEGFSGSLRAERAGVVKVLYFADGQLACASSTDPEDRLGPLLLHEGRLTAKQLELAEEKARAGEALGSVLVNLGFIGPADLMGGARRQVERVVASIAEWPDGEFRARPGPLPERAVNLKLALPSIVVAAARAFATRPQVTAALGGLDAVLERVPDTPLPPMGMDEAQLVGLLDGRRDLRTVLAESSLDDFEAAKLILALHQLGLVRPSGRPAAAAGARAAATLDADEERQLVHVLDAEEEEPIALGAEEAPSGPAPWEEREAPAGWEEEPGPRALPFDEHDTPSPGREAATGEEPDRTGPAWEDESWGEEPAAEEPSSAEPVLPPVLHAESSHRTWLVGAVLIVLAVVVAWIFLRGESQAPTLDITTGAPATAMPTPEPEPTGEAALAPRVEPEPIAPSAAAPPVQPPVTAPPPQAAPTAAAPAAVEKAAPSPKLPEGEGYEAALAAFKSGDLARAADVWKRDPVGSHPGQFTLQLLIACEPATVGKIRERVDPGRSLFLSPIQIRGRGCYRVCWGTYPTPAAAEAARAEVPAYFTAGGEKPIPLALAKLAP